MVPLAYEDRVFTLTPSASGDDVITVRNNDNVFQICFTDSNQGSRSAQYIDEHFAGRQDRHHLPATTSSTPSGIRDNFVAEAEARGHGDRLRGHLHRGQPD